MVHLPLGTGTWEGDEGAGSQVFRSCWDVFRQIGCLRGSETLLPSLAAMAFAESPTHYCPGDWLCEKWYVKACRGCDLYPECADTNPFPRLLSERDR